MGRLRPIKKVLNPSFPKHEDNYKFNPDDIVYVPVCVINLLDEPCEQYCDMAYESIEDASRHFWFDEKGKAVMDEMKVEDYLKQYDKRGMNPFHTINIMEFFSEWRKRNASDN